MTLEEALEFLKKNEYISEDLPSEDIDTLDEVRKYFINNPDSRCVPLFMALFGDHMGWGIFQLCDDVFRKYPNDLIVTHIKESLRSGKKGTKWWAAHWALEFNSPELKIDLLNLIKSKEDADAHFFAISALGDILCITNDQDIKKSLLQRREIEKDGELIELLDEVLCVD